MSNRSSCLSYLPLLLIASPKYQELITWHQLWGAEAHGDIVSSMTSADVEILGAKTAASISARIQGEEIYVDLPALAPVGEYELHLYKAKKTVATFPFIVAFWRAFNLFFF